MGIDAEIYVKTKKRLSDEKVQVLAVRLDDAFGQAAFGSGKNLLRAEGNYYPGCYCQKVIGDLECALSVQVLLRYYGPGYELGNLPLLLSICDFLVSLLEGAVVYYGGDSDVGLDEYTPELRERLWAHFVEHGHKPYDGCWRTGE